MGEIKVITFDVGGTLAGGKLDGKRYQSLASDYLGGLGLGVTLDDYKVATSRALEALRRKRERNLEMRFADFCSIILKNLNITPTQELLEGVRSLYFDCFQQTSRAGVKGVLRELSGEYELGVISNSMSLVPQKFLDEAGLAKYFRVIVISGEVGYRKPHPKILEQALAGFGVGPSEAVHVGNLLEEDVLGAKNVGMYSVLVSSKGLGEEEEVEPDLVVGSIREVPQAIFNLSSPELREIKELLGDRCELCFARGVNLFKIDPEGGDDPENYMLLCPSCRRQTLRKQRLPRVRKRGKYRAVYRRAWAKVHMPRGFSKGLR